MSSRTLQNLPGIYSVILRAGRGREYKGTPFPDRSLDPKRPSGPERPEIGSGKFKVGYKPGGVGGRLIWKEELGGPVGHLLPAPPTADFGGALT